MSNPHAIVPFSLHFEEHPRAPECCMAHDYNVIEPKIGTRQFQGVACTPTAQFLPRYGTR